MSESDLEPIHYIEYLDLSPILTHTKKLAWHLGNAALSVKRLFRQVLMMDTVYLLLDTVGPGKRSRQRRTCWAPPVLGGQDTYQQQSLERYLSENDGKQVQSLSHNCEM